MNRKTRKLVLDMSISELVLWADMGGEIPKERAVIIEQYRRHIAHREHVPGAMFVNRVSIYPRISINVPKTRRGVRVGLAGRAVREERRLARLGKWVA